jgi:hypothetical protein
MGRVAATTLAAILASLAMPAPGASAVPVAPPDTVGVPSLVFGAGAFFGVACPTATRCEAVGDSSLGGVVVPITDGVPGKPIPVPDVYELGGIACESATICLAVGENADNVGVVVPITGSTPGMPITVPGTGFIESIACQTATSCTAVGGPIVPIAGTSPGTPVAVPGTSLTAVACQTATSCTAVGRNTTSFDGVVVPIADGTPGVPATVPGEPFESSSAIACQSTGSCTAVGINANNFGDVVTIQDGAPAAPVKARGHAAFFGIACETITLCEGVGQSGVSSQKGAVVPISSGDPGFPIAARGAFGHPSLNAVACVSSTTCEVVGTSGYSGLVVASCAAGAHQSCAKLAGEPTSHHATVTDHVTCQSDTGPRCVITQQLRTLDRRLVAAKTLRITPEFTEPVTLKLNGTGKRLLRKLGKLRVTLTISQAQTGGSFLILNRRLKLRR